MPASRSPSPSIHPRAIRPSSQGDLSRFVAEVLNAGLQFAAALCGERQANLDIAQQSDEKFGTYRGLMFDAVNITTLLSLCLIVGCGGYLLGCWIGYRISFCGETGKQFNDRKAARDGAAPHH